MVLFKKWPLCCCILLMCVVLGCSAAFDTKDFGKTPVGLAIAIVSTALVLPGVGALLCAPARLLIGVCRKTLAYETHADAALVVLLECLCFLLANLHM